MPDLSGTQALPSLICTLILGLLAARNLRKGQSETTELEADKQELDRERLKHEEAKSANDIKDRLIEQINIQLDRETQRADRERADGVKWYERFMQSEKEKDVLREQLHDLAHSLLSQAQLIAARDGVTPADMPEPPDP